jgi:CheY-like chemotaxis protein
MSSGVILVVDDDEIVLRTMGNMLKVLGVEARTAMSGEEALAWLEAGGAPAAVITDHLMSGMSGLELLGRAEVLAPSALQVLHTGLAVVEVTARPGFALTVLAKPAPMALLKRLLAAAVTRPVSETDARGR